MDEYGGLLSQQYQYINVYNAVINYKYNRNNTNASIPEFLFIGFQGSGKSSAISQAIKLPIGVIKHGTATRCPSRFKLISNPKQDKLLLITVNGIQCKDEAALYNEIWKINRKLEEDNIISTDFIEIMLESSQIPQVTFIDLPGLIRTDSQCFQTIKTELNQLTVSLLHEQNDDGLYKYIPILVREPVDIEHDIDFEVKYIDALVKRYDDIYDIDGSAVPPGFQTMSVYLEYLKANPIHSASIYEYRSRKSRTSWTPTRTGLVSHYIHTEDSNYIHSGIPGPPPPTSHASVPFNSDNNKETSYFKPKVKHYGNNKRIDWKDDTLFIVNKFDKQINRSPALDLVQYMEHCCRYGLTVITISNAKGRNTANMSGEELYGFILNVEKDEDEKWREVMTYFDGENDENLNELKQIVSETCGVAKMRELLSLKMFNTVKKILVIIYVNHVEYQYKMTYQIPDTIIHLILSYFI